MNFSGFIFYVVAVILVSLVMIVYVAPRFGRSNILVYIFICSIVGSLSVLSVKGLGLVIKETIGGKQQFTNFLTWFWLIAVILCISLQLVSFPFFSFFFISLNYWDNETGRGWWIILEKVIHLHRNVVNRHFIYRLRMLKLVIVYQNVFTESSLYNDRK